MSVLLVIFKKEKELYLLDLEASKRELMKEDQTDSCVNLRRNFIESLIWCYSKKNYYGFKNPGLNGC